MRFSVQLLAVAATVLSFNATPRDNYTLPTSVLSPAVASAAFEVTPADALARVAHENEPARPASPMAWILAAGFLGLVILRRMRPE